MKNNKTAKWVAGSTMAVLLMGYAAPAFALGSFSLEGTRGNAAGDDTVSFSSTPPDYADGSEFLFNFEGRGDTGVYKFMRIGGGIAVAGGQMSVTTSSIETTDGTLQNTLDGKVSTTTFNTLATTVSGLSSPAQVQADWNDASTTASDFIKNKPTIPAAQIQTDWNQSSSTAKDFVKNKPALAAVATTSSYTDLTNKPTLGISYEGTTLRANSFPIFKSATVSSGTVVFNMTSDGTSGGTALFPNGVIQDSVNLTVNDATAAYQMSWVWSNSNKTLTVTANKLTTANILTGILGQGQANSSVVKLSVWGY